MIEASDTIEPLDDHAVLVSRIERLEEEVEGMRTVYAEIRARIRMGHEQDSLE